MPQPLRVGLIGVGRWGQAYLRTLAELTDRCRLTHVCTSRPLPLAAPAGVGVVSEWPALLGAECDAVIVATPPHTHAEILEGCLEARTPCLIEKPLCLDVATAERLHRLVESSGVPVLVDHTQLFNPAYVALRRALEQAAEPIRLICSEGMALGPFRTHTSALWDWTPHDVSLCLDLLGALPERLDALAGPAGPTGTPEQVSIRLDFPSGAAAWIQAGRLSPQRRRLLSVVTDRQLYVLEDGAAEPLTASAIRWPERYAQGLPDALPRRAIPLPSATPPLAAAVAYFLDGLQGGDRTKFGTELALNVVKVLAACEAAIAERAAARHEPHAVS